MVRYVLPIRPSSAACARGSPSKDHRRAQWGIAQLQGLIGSCGPVVLGRWDFPIGYNFAHPYQCNRRCLRALGPCDVSFPDKCRPSISCGPSSSFLAVGRWSCRRTVGPLLWVVPLGLHTRGRLMRLLSLFAFIRSPFERLRLALTVSLQPWRTSLPLPTLCPNVDHTRSREGPAVPAPVTLSVQYCCGLLIRVVLR